MMNEGELRQCDHGPHRSLEMILEIYQPALIVAAAALPLRNAGAVYLRIQAFFCGAIGDAHKLELIAYGNAMPMLGWFAAALAKCNGYVICI